MVQNLKQQHDKNTRIIPNFLFFVVENISIIMRFVFKLKKLVRIYSIINLFIYCLFFSPSTTDKSFSYPTSKSTQSATTSLRTSSSTTITISRSTSSTWWKCSTTSSMDSKNFPYIDEENICSFFLQQPPPSHMFQTGPPTAPPAMPMPPIPPPPMMIEQAFHQQIQALQERLRQSEVNLVAQRESTQLNKKVSILISGTHMTQSFSSLLDQSSRKYSSCSSSTNYRTGGRIEY